MEKITPPKPQSLRSYVEDYLRQAILSGKYKAGDRLVEREICEILNVSRPPVREALRQLDELLNQKNSMLFELSNKKSIWKKIALASAATSAFIFALFNKE